MSDLVLLCGIPTESPIALVRERLETMGQPFLVLSQRWFERSDAHVEIQGGRISGYLSLDGQRHSLDDFGAVYTRLMDDQSLPELTDEPPDSPTRARSRTWHEVLSRWYEIAPIRVVNRAGAMASNGSKPFQAQTILRHGFRTPETLITSDPDAARAFHAQHGRVIFKSTSGVRSVVRTLDEQGLQRLDRIRSCPVQFQAYVPGLNVRVHTVGADVFATRIVTDATDYRYARAELGEPAVLEPAELDDEVAARCLALASDLRLPFAGIDLKVTPDDEVYCFEVNPSPAYSYYESHTDQPISLALARLLAGT